MKKTNPVESFVALSVLGIFVLTVPLVMDYAGMLLPKQKITYEQPQEEVFVPSPVVSHFSKEYVVVCFTDNVDYYEVRYRASKSRGYEAEQNMCKTNVPKHIMVVQN